MILKTLKDFGAVVREARKAQAMTQTSLAEKLGTNQDWISNLENGRLENPSLGSILRAFGVLGVDLHVGNEPRSAPEEPFDTGDLATDEPAFLKGPSR